ncbi:MAG: BMP family ABC transporter substrate-binding protein [SAR202 cluster bacterium]|nr:BMP family ABC transporter substrate-binding protein [Chloroflexota bacterium]MQG22172.1 BMP family ABC transporter substrate-binding protein [SAR202 cluster bacterium]
MYIKSFNVPKKLLLFISSLLLFVMILPACDSDDTSSSSSSGESIGKFGMILVGPRDDKGWSQAHFEGGQHIVDSIGAEMIVADLINPADSPNTTVEQVASDMIAQGAELIFATSDDMKDGILAAAKDNPDVPMIWSSGDSAWAEGKAHKSDLGNLGNIMGQMEFGKYMAGCAAASESKSGNIGFLGPLINDETRRLANAAYVGAKDCWADKGNDPANLNFEVTWIGFWFHIPGVTLDPTTVVNDFYDSGVDVVISHIDTPEALIVTDQRASSGEDVLVVGYDYENSCDQAPSVCLGVPYFNWGPSYTNVAKSVGNDSFKATFDWVEPEIKNGKTDEDSMIGFKYGEALSNESKKRIESTAKDLSGDVRNIFTGPLNYQDGSEYVSSGKTASLSEIWYTTQLLEGIVGDSGSN